MKKFIDGIKIGLGILFILFVGFYLVNARSGLTASQGDKLTSAKWNELVGNLFWKSSGSDIYYTGGNVGIGTNAPSAKLDVGGSIKAGNIDQGCYYISMTANTLHSFTIPFNKTFAIKPNVGLTLLSTQGGATFALYLTAVSTTGFVSQLKNTVSGTAYICRIAIGD